MTAVEAVTVLASNYFWSTMDRVESNDLIEKHYFNLTGDLIYAIVGNRKVTNEILQSVKND